MIRFPLKQPRTQARTQRPNPATASFGVPKVIVNTSILRDSQVAEGDIHAAFYDSDVDMQDPDIQEQHMNHGTIKPDSALFTGERDLWGNTWILKEKTKRIYNAISQFDPNATDDDCDPHADVSSGCHCS